MLPDQGDARGEEDQPRGCEDDSEPIPCERQPHATSTLSPRDDSMHPFQASRYQDWGRRLLPPGSSSTFLTGSATEALD